MNPMPQPRGGKIAPPSNEYTAILVIAVGVMLATIAYVAWACYGRYETIFGMP